MGDALGIVLMHGIVEGSDKSIIECQSSIMCLVLRLTLCVFLKVQGSLTVHDDLN